LIALMTTMSGIIGPLASVRSVSNATDTLSWRTGNISLRPAGLLTLLPEAPSGAEAPEEVRVGEAWVEPALA